MLNAHHWRPLVEREYNPTPENDGIDFVLTQAERSQVARYKVDLERQRRQRNRTDRARELQQAVAS